MTTSGTVARTSLKVDDFITRAAKRCGFETGDIGSEMAEVGQQNLYLLLSELANHGVTLWTQRATLIGTVPNKLAYDLPDGTVDIKDGLFYSVTLPAGGTASSSPGGTASNAFDYNTPLSACTQTGANGSIGYDFGTTVVIPVVGVLPNGAKTLNLLWEFSTDNVNWTSYYAPGEAVYPAGVTTWAQINVAPSGQYYRVREIGGNTLDVCKIVMGQNPTGLPMNRMNRDDYSNLPNPTQSGTQTLQYFVQRLINAPQTLTWPVPQSYFNYFLFWNFRQIEDVGDLTNTVEIPQRWTEAVISSLAWKIAMEYPKKVNIADRSQLETYAEKKIREAEDEERDDSPIYLGPNISCYTS